LQQLHPRAVAVEVRSLVLQQGLQEVLAVAQKVTRLAQAERLHHLDKALQVVLVLEAEQQAVVVEQPQ
jgi:nitrate reductase NapAB chaperone NapD